MARSPAFQFYPDKWNSHTKHLSDYAYRIYHLILCWMWEHSPDYCSCPSDPAAIAILLGEPVDRVEGALLEIQNANFPLLKLKRKKLSSNGLKKEAEKQGSRRKKAQKSAKSRWDREKQPMRTHAKADAVASPKQCSPTPTPTPTPTPEDNTTHTPPSGQGRNGIQAAFDELWKNYPSKTGKTPAFKAYQKAHKAGVSDETIRDGIARYIRYVEDQRREFPGLKWKNGSTWFNQRGWDDEYQVDSEKKKKATLQDLFAERAKNGG